MVVLGQVHAQAGAGDSSPIRAVEPGQVIEAKVVAQSDNGVTRLAIGKTVVEVKLPPGLVPGQTVHIQVQGKGADLSLVLLHKAAATPQAPASAQIAEAKVVALLDNGLTRLAIGKTVVDVALPPGLEPGQTLRIQVPSQGGARSPLPLGQTTANAEVLKPGTITEARVTAVLDNGLTRVAIGKSEVDIALPRGLQPGQTVTLQAQGSGAEQKLAPVGRITATTQNLAPGQTSEATVIGRSETGATRLAIGKTIVDAALPPGLQSGQSVRVQVIGSGAQQSLVLLSASRPTAQAPPPGHVAEAKVQAVLDNGLTRVAIGKTVVDVALPPGLKPGQTLRLQLVGNSASQATNQSEMAAAKAAGDVGQRLALAVQALPPGPLQATAVQMALSAVGRQDGMSALFANLAALRQSGERVPETVGRAADQALATRLGVTGRPPTGALLQQAILRSGVFLESLLAGGKPSPAQTGPGGDLKSALLSLKGALESWLGDEKPLWARPQGERLKPPVRGALPQGQKPAMPSLPEGARARDTARLLLTQTDAALSRIRLAQLASLGDGAARSGVAQASAAGEWNTEIPLTLGNETGMAQFQIQRDGGQDGPDSERGWQMRFSIDFEATGGVHAKVTLRAGRVGVMLWAERPETSEALAENMTDLAEALEAIGLTVGAIHTRDGKPQEPAAPVGVFMDQNT